MLALYRWKLVSMQQNVLGGAARNFGVRESSGDILLYLDSDDLYLERHIAVCVASLIRAPQLAMVRPDSFALRGD
jgi:glycosyltransferase involved in cell wall biosynthesis